MARRVIFSESARQGAPRKSSNAAASWVMDSTPSRSIWTAGQAVAAAWTKYHSLEIDEARSCFVVELEEGGTRMLRAWLHTDPCGRCSRDGRRVADRQAGIRS